MKKRYLSMLMAVVLCLTLCTGAFAASGEIETAASEEITEPVADGQVSETPAESAEYGETPQTQALDGESADVPVLMAQSSGGESNANPSTLSPYPATGTAIEGYAIAGYGGTVSYGYLLNSSAPGENLVSDYNFANYFQWEEEDDNKKNTILANMTVSGKRETVSTGVDKRFRHSDIKISVKAGAGEEEYNFTINKEQKIGITPTKYTGKLTVLSLMDARNTEKYPDVVKYEGFKLYKYTGTATSPTPLAGAVFGLYTSNPATVDAAPSPVATFTTDKDGYATIKLDKDTAGNALPKLGDPTKTDAEKGGTNYYLKEIEAPDGYALSDTVWSVFGYAKWETNEKGATTSLKFVLEHPQDSGNGKWDESDANNIKFAVSNRPLPNEYVGFDLVAWAKKDVTETGYGKELLDGVKFGVYSDAECTTLVKEFTTGTDGTVKIDPEQFADVLPTLGNTKTFYLKQTGAQNTKHGPRPMATVKWSFTATAVESESRDKYAHISLSMPQSVDDGNGVGQEENGKFWIENERYVSLSFDLVKQVVKTDETMPLGENRFDFAIVPCTFGDSSLAYPELVFTPEGGSPVTLSDHSTAEIDGKQERVYQVSLTVDGEGTAKGTVTMQGWESSMRPLDVYETGEAPQDWEYADCMYMLQPTNTKLAIRFCPESADGSYTGYAGKKYDPQSGERKDGVVFTNRYTKLAPIPTATPAPTATPEPAKAVKTGDAANLALWLALATASALGLGYVCLKKKEN